MPALRRPIKKGFDTASRRTEESAAGRPPPPSWRAGLPEKTLLIAAGPPRLAGRGDDEAGLLGRRRRQGAQGLAIELERGLGHLLHGGSPGKRTMGAGASGTPGDAFTRKSAVRDGDRAAPVPRLVLDGGRPQRAGQAGGLALAVVR